MCLYFHNAKSRFSHDTAHILMALFIHSGRANRLLLFHLFEQLICIQLCWGHFVDRWGREMGRRVKFISLIVLFKSLPQVDEQLTLMEVAVDVVAAVMMTVTDVVAMLAESFSAYVCKTQTLHNC